MELGTAWLVIACDLPYLKKETIEYLIKQREITATVTAYKNRKNDLAEPLCAIYEPSSYKKLKLYLEKGIKCPRTILMDINTKLIYPLKNQELDNINTKYDYQKVKKEFV